MGSWSLCSAFSCSTTSWTGFHSEGFFGCLKVRQNPAEQLVTNWDKLSFSQPECTLKLCFPLVNWRYEIKVKGFVSLVIYTRVRDQSCWKFCCNNGLGSRHSSFVLKHVWSRMSLQGKNHVPQQDFEDVSSILQQQSHKSIDVDLTLNQSQTMETNI